MFSITEQLSAATKSQLEVQLKILNNFATTAFEGAQKVIALNIHTTKASVEQGSATARELLEARDPQEFFKLSAQRVPNFDGVFAYNRELFSIASKAQAELLQTAQEQFKEAGKQAVRVPKLATSVAKAAAPAAAPVPAPAVEPEVEPAVEAAVAAAIAEPEAPAPVVAASAPLTPPAPKAEGKSANGKQSKK